ncbi:Uncharacterised protein [Bordetella pertussis]|nr:Uncharacterised protein [Bordetella pertussis]
MEFFLARSSNLFLLLLTWASRSLAVFSSSTRM